mgnify:FL=1
MSEALIKMIQDFLDNLAKLLVGLAVLCKWAAGMTLAGY